MARDDRTEKATPKRRRKAKGEGRVARSPDVSGWLLMLVGTMILPTLFRSADSRLTKLVGQSANVIASPSSSGALGMLVSGLNDTAALILPVLGAFAIAGVAAGVAQTGGVLSLHAAAPKWGKLNPFKGFKNLLSTQSLWQLLKQLVKLLALVGLAYGTISGLSHKLVGSDPAQMAPLVSYAGSTLLGLTRDVAGMGLVLGIGDFAWQRHQLNKSLKMTKQEVKDENKDADGNPTLKGQVRRKMRGMSRARMMAAVAGSDLIVVNPTHYAVALRYDPQRGSAPVVVAKGTDEVALRIRAEGTAHRVPVIEDPPLARAIHATCEIDDAIPPELFLAVARLLAFVFTMPPVIRSAGLVHRRPSSAMVA